MNKNLEIRQALKRIANEKHSNGIFFVAKVVSSGVDECVVQYDDLNLTARTSSIVDGNENKLLIKPKVGSNVIIADMFGDLRTLFVVVFSEVESITVNGGNLGGLVNIDALTNKLNQLVSTFNAHVHPAALGTSPVTVSVTASQASPFSKSDYEDNKIKH